MKLLTTTLLTLLFLLFACKSHQNTVSKTSSINRTLSHRQVNSHKNVLQKLKNEYKKYKGVKYRYGGTTSLGFDCSGFVQRVYMNAFHKNLPRTTRAMMKTGKKISKDNLKPGDLVFFHPTRKYYHVGIYMGKGIFMHASSSRGITKSKMDLKYWKKSFVTAKRVL